jgi:hypothetical protein
MVAYTGIQGQNILIVSSDPAKPTECQIWYNSTSNLLKGYQFATVNAWATGGNLNNVRVNPQATSNGTQTASLVFGGQDNVGGIITNSESYNGTSWTNTPSLNTARQDGSGAGIQTAALAFAGENPGGSVAATESWNGSSWTSLSSPSNLGTPRGQTGGVGTQTSAVVFGGNPNVTATEKWDGSVWTSSGNLNTGRRDLVGAGIQTAAIAFGGIIDSTPNSGTESFNGTSWTSVTSLNTARRGLGGAGTQTLALAFGGDPGTITGATELWNGTSWTNNPTGLATARTGLTVYGASQGSALCAGGSNGTAVQSLTEEWTSQALQVKTITTS